MKTLNDDGWDVIAAKYPYSPAYAERAANLSSRAVPHLQRRTGELRAQGYKKVIVIGQSWGSWTTLLAARDNQLAVDAAVLLVPATWGPKTTNGHLNQFFELNRTEFGPLLAAVKIPVAVVFFADDAFDPGGRGDIAKDIFRRSTSPNLLIDRPPGFKGHYAGWLPIFDFVFGSCLHSFIEAPVTSECPMVPLDDADFRSIVKKDQVVDFDNRKIGSADELKGGTFIIYRTAGGPVQAEFDQGAGLHTLRAKGVVDGKFSFTSGRICYLDECLDLVRWDEKHLIGFDSTSGQARSWWTQE